MILRPGSTGWAEEEALSLLMSTTATYSSLSLSPQTFFSLCLTKSDTLEVHQQPFVATSVLMGLFSDMRRGSSLQITAIPARSIPLQ